MWDQKNIACYRENEDGDIWTMPVPELAFKMKYSWVHPRVLYVMPFPRIQADEEEDEEDGYNNDVVNLMCARTGDDAERGEKQRSDLASMAEFNTKTLRAIREDGIGIDGQPYETLAEAMNQYQTQALFDFNIA